VLFPSLDGKNTLSPCSLVLKTILMASLRREESLGSFRRKEFPNEAGRSKYGSSRILYDAESRNISISYGSQ
jgi:hypothetical protein